MTREEAIAYGKRAINLGLNDETQAFCELAIKALEQEPLEVEATKLQKAYNKGFEDCRQAVKKCKQYVFKTQDMPFPRSDFFFKVEDVMALPSVHAEPKAGHWVTLSSTEMYCSECNEIEYLNKNRRFCAYCGARMESEDKG